MTLGRLRAVYAGLYHNRAVPADQLGYVEAALRRFLSGQVPDLDAAFEVEDFVGPGGRWDRQRNRALLEDRNEALRELAEMYPGTAWSKAVWLHRLLAGDCSWWPAAQYLQTHDLPPPQTVRGLYRVLTD